MSDDLPPDLHIVPPAAAEAAAEAFFKYVERASLLGLLVFLLNKSKEPIPSLLLGALCVVGSLLFIAPFFVRGHGRLAEWMRTQSGSRPRRTFALGVAALLVLSLCGAVIAIAVGETLSKTFN